MTKWSVRKVRPSQPTNKEAKVIHTRTRNRLRRRALGVLAGLTVGYVTVSALVLALEYRIEVDKISRGTFTDTFSPFLYTNIVTFPASAFHSVWRGYPEEFQKTTYRDALHASIEPAIVNIAVQVIVFLTVCGVVLALRSSGRSPAPKGQQKPY